MIAKAHILKKLLFLVASYGKCTRALTIQHVCKAFVWLRRAALQGHVDAAVAAGHLCRIGRGVTARNETRALNYMLFAADRDSPQGLLHAAQLLLLRHERETETEREIEGEKARGKEGWNERDRQDSSAASDRATAIEFLQRAVHMGDREAFFVLARELSDGSGGERREGQALLLGAAEKGDVHAMFHWHKFSKVLYTVVFT